MGHCAPLDPDAAAARDDPLVQPQFKKKNYPDHCCQTCSDGLYNVYSHHQAVEF